MCDLVKLEEGYTLPPEVTLDSTTLYDPPQNICLKYEKSYIRLKRLPTTAQIPVQYFKNEGLPDGIFNFIFTRDKSLTAAPIENGFEIGVKHKHLALQVQTRTVVASGEMMKSGNMIQFNLSSGTFMKDFMTRVLEQKCDNELIKKTVELFKLYYPRYKVQFVSQTFINLTDVPLKREHLLKYANAGYEIRLYSMKKNCVVEEGSYTLFQSAARRKTRRRKSRKN